MRRILRLDGRRASAALQDARGSVSTTARRSGFTWLVARLTMFPIRGAERFVSVGVHMCCYRVANADSTVSRALPYHGPKLGRERLVRGAMEPRPGRLAAHDQAADDIEQKKAQHHRYLSKSPTAEDGISVEEPTPPRRMLNNRTMSTQSTMSKASGKSVRASPSRVGGICICARLPSAV